MRSATSTLLLALAVLVGTWVPASAAQQALTARGDVYFVEHGRYGDLFPDGAEAASDAAVLAISVLRGDGAGERWLVPGTEGPEAEGAAALAAGPDGRSVYLLWQAASETSRLRLAGLSGDGWGDEIDVSRGSAVVSGSPRLVATRDTSVLTAGAEGEPAMRARSVLHIAWHDESGEAIYAPVVLDGDTYVGDHSLFELSRFAPEPAEGAEPAAVPTSLTLEPGEEGAAVVAFTLPASGELVSLELRPIAGELSEIGDRLRDGILDLARDLEPGDPESLDSLADGARAQLINVGRDLRPAILGILAAELDRYIRETGGDWAFQPEIMATRTRAHLVEHGASFDRTPISNLYSPARAQLINVGLHLEAPDRSHDLSVRVAAARPAPEVPPEAVSAVYLSASGRSALVAWAEEGSIYYRESQGQAWGPATTLGIDADSDPALIEKLLSQRVRGR